MREQISILANSHLVKERKKKKTSERNCLIGNYTLLGRFNTHSVYCLPTLSTVLCQMALRELCEIEVLNLKMGI